MIGEETLNLDVFVTSYNSWTHKITSWIYVRVSFVGEVGASMGSLIGKNGECSTYK